MQWSFVNIRIREMWIILIEETTLECRVKKSWGKEGGQERILGWIIGDVYFHRWSNRDKNSSIYVPRFFFSHLSHPRLIHFVLHTFHAGNVFPRFIASNKTTSFRLFLNLRKESNFYCITNFKRINHYRIVNYTLP